MVKSAKDRLHHLTTEFGEFYQYATSIDYISGHRQDFINIYNAIESMVDDICNIENDLLWHAVSKEINIMGKALYDIMGLSIYFDDEFRAYRKAKAQTPPESESPPESTSTNDPVRVAEAVKALETAKSKDVPEMLRKLSKQEVEAVAEATNTNIHIKHPTKRYIISRIADDMRCVEDSNVIQNLNINGNDKQKADRLHRYVERMADESAS